MRQVRTRPVFSERTRPEASSTARCCITAGSDIASGRASSLTETGCLRQPLDDRPPGRIGEGLKGAVERAGMVKHKL